MRVAFSRELPYNAFRPDLQRQRTGPAAWGRRRTSTQPPSMESISSSSSPTAAVGDIAGTCLYRVFFVLFLSPRPWTSYMATNLATANLRDPVTAHMHQDFTRVLLGQTVGEALDELRQHPPKGRIIYFYVVDEQGRLQGVVPTR